MRAAAMVAKHVGGKILLFASSPPTVGEGVVRREMNRDKGGQGQGERDNDLLKPAAETYQVCSVSVDISVFVSVSPSVSH